MDFGCNNGAFLDSLSSKAIGRLVGLDVSRSAVAEAHKMFPHLDIRCIDTTVPLPFADATFTSITILDVIEHIDEQHELLTECRRLLDDDGVLIVTVPGRHLFSFLDVGNFKFFFPDVHRWWYSWRHTPEEYRRRYVSNPEGLVGDVSAKKRWHEHFSRAHLAELLAGAGFCVVRFDGTGLFARPLGIMRYFLRRSRRLLAFLERIQKWDAARFEATDLFCVARKARPN